MKVTNAIRIRHEQTISLTGVSLPDLSKGFTLEAWVKLAHTDKSTRLYSQANYMGLSVPLKAGAITDLSARHLPQLGSVDLPPAIDAVFFTEPHFKGESLALKDDVPTVPYTFQQVRSAVVLDRSHRRQSHAILFEKANFEGKVQVLTLPHHWDRSTGGNGQLPSVGSAWIPPGVALDTEHVGGATTYTGDQPTLSDGVSRIIARRVSQENENDSSSAVKPTLGLIGIMSCGDNAMGLVIEQKQGQGTLRSTTELRFGSAQLRTGHWYHIAQSWDGTTLRWILDGKEVKTETRASLPFSDDWVLGCNFRGSMAEAKVWGTARTIAKIRDERYPPVINPATIDAAVASNEAVEDISQDPSFEELEALSASIPQPAQVTLVGVDALLPEAPSDLVKFLADLPKAPTQSTVFTKIQHQLQVDHSQQLLEAKQKAAATKTKAEKQVLRQQTLAREHARREVHLQGIKRLCFVRGNTFVRDVRSVRHENRGRLTELSITFIQSIPPFPDSFKITDATLDDNDTPFLAIDGSIRGIKPIYRVDRQLIETPTGRAVINFKLGNLYKSDQPGSLLSVTCDYSDKNPIAVKQRDIIQPNPDPNAAYALGEYSPTILYWAQANGTICQTLSYANDNADKNGQIIFNVPIGRITDWDMVVDMQRQVLVWSNGYELFSAPVSPIKDYQLLMPHVASPHPIAVAIAPDSSVVWVDAEDEVVRILPYDQGNGTFGEPWALYSAPNPGRGLTICELPDSRNIGKEAAFVYWVAAQRQVHNVAVLDTPGRYIDLDINTSTQSHADALVRHFIDADQQNVRAVAALDEEVKRIFSITGHEKEILQENFNQDTRFSEMKVPTDLKDYRNADHLAYGSNILVYGPFNLEDGFSINIGFKPSDDAWVSPFFKGYPGQPLFSLDTEDPFGIITAFASGRLNMPWNNDEITFDDFSRVDEWMKFRCDVKLENEELLIKGWLDRKLLFDTKHTNNTANLFAKKKYKVCIGEFYPSLRPFSGWISEVKVTAHDDPGRILAWQNAEKSVGAVSQDNKIFNSKAIDLPPILVFENAEDNITFDPIYLDLKKGLTLSASIHWDGPAADSVAPMCFYELATFEDEERLVCSIDATGLPQLHLRWAGRLLTKDIGSTESEQRLNLMILHRVTWTLSPQGEVATYIDGERVWSGKLNFHSEPRIFTNHRLGSPNTEQTHAEIPGARLYDHDDAVAQFDSFKGRLLNFQAWNTYLPSAAVSADNLPGPDPLWSRNLLTAESKRRYLHAGRLDGQEPAVVLFPIDLDNGLCIQTNLDQAHAELTRAHAQMAANEAYAAHLKESALNDAHTKLAAATQKLADIHAKNQADIQAATDKANADKANAQLQKADADAKAQRDKSAASKNADDLKAKGKQQAEQQETQAANDKNTKTANINRQLNDKRQQRDAKQQEYDSKR